MDNVDIHHQVPSDITATIDISPVLIADVFMDDEPYGGSNSPTKFRKFTDTDFQRRENYEGICKTGRFLDPTMSIENVEARCCHISLTDGSDTISCAIVREETCPPGTVSKDIVREFLKINDPDEDDEKTRFFNAYLSDGVNDDLNHDHCSNLTCEYIMIKNGWPAADGDVSNHSSELTCDLGTDLAINKYYPWLPDDNEDSADRYSRRNTCFTEINNEINENGIYQRLSDNDIYQNYSTVWKYPYIERDRPNIERDSDPHPKWEIAQVDSHQMVKPNFRPEFSNTEISYPAELRRLKANIDDRTTGSYYSSKVNRNWNTTHTSEDEGGDINEYYEEVVLEDERSFEKLCLKSVADIFDSTDNPADQISIWSDNYPTGQEMLEKLETSIVNIKQLSSDSLSLIHI